MWIVNCVKFKIFSRRVYFNTLTELYLHYDNERDLKKKEKDQTLFRLDEHLKVYRNSIKLMRYELWCFSQ